MKLFTFVNGPETLVVNAESQNNAWTNLAAHLTDTGKKVDMKPYRDFWSWDKWMGMIPSGV